MARLTQYPQRLSRCPIPERQHEHDDGLPPFRTRIVLKVISIGIRTAPMRKLSYKSWRALPGGLKVPTPKSCLSPCVQANPAPADPMQTNDSVSLTYRSPPVVFLSPITQTSTNNTQLTGLRLSVAAVQCKSMQVGNLVSTCTAKLTPV